MVRRNTAGNQEIRQERDLSYSFKSQSESPKTLKPISHMMLRKILKLEIPIIYLDTRKQSFSFSKFCALFVLGKDARLTGPSEKE